MLFILEPFLVREDMPFRSLEQVLAKPLPMSSNLAVSAIEVCSLLRRRRGDRGHVVLCRNHEALVVNRLFHVFHLQLALLNLRLPERQVLSNNGLVNVPEPCGQCEVVCDPSDAVRQRLYSYRIG